MGALAQISEYSEAGITVRGTYYGPGKAIPEGDRKLYLAIESTQALSVQKAKVEITRLLKEELLKLQSSALHHINKGRYQVLRLLSSLSSTVYCVLSFIQINYITAE